ncbi:MAG: HAMP domain-containing sensor histidine kinase, partial [Halobacteria archaeon]|nr:HAMP domain-containing sensor histidine kinase [Halobacteria archaeon]
RNSVEHAGKDVTVRVGGSENGFYVKDDGEGIPEKERDAVFNTGYTSANDGTGLGLSIVEKVVEAHGWSIEVSESEEGGARFDIHVQEQGSE